MSRPIQSVSLPICAYTLTHLKEALPGTLSDTRPRSHFVNMQDQVAMLSILTQRKVFSTLSPQVQAQVLTGVEQISRATWHHSRLFAIAGAMTIWDAAVSFSTERRVIWKAKPSITKVSRMTKQLEPANHDNSMLTSGPVTWDY